MMVADSSSEAVERLRLAITASGHQPPDVTLSTAPASAALATLRQGQSFDVIVLPTLAAMTPDFAPASR
jgi:hypothetical protein